MTAYRLIWSLGFVLLMANAAFGGDAAWHHLSSSRGELPLLGTGKQQAGLVVADFDKNGTNDVIIGFSDKAPALVLMRGSTNRSSLPIELEFVPITGGGTVLDVDRDGDDDVIFTTSDPANTVCWWENPYPNFSSERSWVRRTVYGGTNSSAVGVLAADIARTGDPQLVWWHARSNLFQIVNVPASPRDARGWPGEVLAIAPGFSPKAINSLAAGDIDMDGLVDLVAGNYWFKFSQGQPFTPVRFEDEPGLVAVGRFRQSFYPQFVMAPANSRGKVRWYECVAFPDKPVSWAGRDLPTIQLNHASALAVGNLDQDGGDDIVVGELAPGNSEPKAWVIYSDKRGNFTPALLGKDIELGEARLADLDNDVDLDIVSIPKTWNAPALNIWINLTSPKPGQ